MQGSRTPISRSRVNRIVVEVFIEPYIICCTWSIIISSQDARAQRFTKLAVNHFIVAMTTVCESHTRYPISHSRISNTVLVSKKWAWAIFGHMSHGNMTFHSIATGVVVSEWISQ